MASVSHPLASTDLARNKGRSHWLSGRRLGFAWLFIALVVIASVAYATFAGPTSLTPSQRVSKLEAEFKCPSCIDLSVADSTSASSVSIKDFIKAQVAADRSNQQIRDALVGSYGTSILFTPPSTGVAGLAWIIPIAFIGIVGVEVIRRTVVGGAGGNTAGVLQKPDVQEKVPWVASIAKGDSLRAEGDGPQEATTSSKRQSGSLQERRRVMGITGVVLILAAGVVYYVGSRGSANTNVPSASVVETELSQAINFTFTGQDVQALRLFSAVLRVDPFQVQALSYEGWLLFQAGQKSKSAKLTKEGVGLINEAVQISPQYPDAHGFLAMVDLSQLKGRTKAAAEFKTFLADSPDSQIKSVLTTAYHNALVAP